MTTDPSKLGSVDRFMWSLGSFVANFAVVETTVRRAMWHFAGVSDRVANAVFSDKKADGSMELISRISAAQGWKPKDKESIGYVIGQLKLLNKLRNNLLHWGARGLSRCLRFVYM